MSALYRMAFSTHRQVDLGPGDRVIISASAIPGNEKTIGRVINELFRKGVDVIYNKSDPLHVSGHACQEELKIIHALVRPRFFIPVHGEQKMLRRHVNLALDMGMDRNHIVLPEIGNVIEITARTIKVNGSVPSGELLVDGSGVGDVGAVVLRDRKILAEDGMVVVILNISSHNNQLLSAPEIITRGFIYVKENEEMLKELSQVAMGAVGTIKSHKDLAEARSAVKSAVSNYLFKHTRRSPMIIPVINRI